MGSNPGNRTAITQPRKPAIKGRTADQFSHVITSKEWLHLDRPWGKLGTNLTWEDRKGLHHAAFVS
ncbi:hypothetical protein GCM10017322_40200 [Paracoccus aerius]|nr:hypothetical protein GCM10017322_40200 [Paracoccus aerius]